MIATPTTVRRFVADGGATGGHRSTGLGRSRVLPVMLLFLAGSSACASRAGSSASDTLSGSPDASTASMEAPRLTQLRPDTIPLGRGEVPTLVLTGTGFVPGTAGAFATGANRVHVGRATVEGIAADSSGTVLRFALPLTYTDTTAKGRPSSFTPGHYPVSVSTPRGTSNTLTLTMIP